MKQKWKCFNLKKWHIGCFPLSDFLSQKRSYQKLYSSIFSPGKDKKCIQKSDINYNSKIKDKMPNYFHGPKYILVKKTLSRSCVHVLSHFSHVRLFVTPQTAAHQAPLSMGVSRQKYLSGLPLPPPGDLPAQVTLNTKAKPTVCYKR